MIISAHQPNYIPWIGYFHKMAWVDKFVLADDVQYSSQSYTNRARIKTARGKLWLTVPVLTKGLGFPLIKDVRIDQSKNWQQKHWQSLQVNYSSSPYFGEYAPYFEEIYQKEWDFLVDLNISFLELIRGFLGIQTPIFQNTQLVLRATNPSERIIDMVKAMGGSTYISGRGGSLNYLQEDLFQEAGITLDFDEFSHPTYSQQFEDFIPGLSIIDLLFNEGPDCRRFFQQRDEAIEQV